MLNGVSICQSWIFTWLLACEKGICELSKRKKVLNRLEELFGEGSTWTSWCLLLYHLVPPFLFHEPAPSYPAPTAFFSKKHGTWHVFQIVIVRRLGLDFGARQTMIAVVTGSFNSTRILDKFTTIKWVCYTNLSGLWEFKNNGF